MKKIIGVPAFLLLLATLAAAQDQTAVGGNRFYAVFSDPIFGEAVFPFTVQNKNVTGVTVKVADFVEYNPL
ncbi:MAG: hypothetical protein ABI813_02810 [Bacteroidota bacterium]